MELALGGPSGPHSPPPRTTDTTYAGVLPRLRDDPRLADPRLADPRLADPRPPLSFSSDAYRCSTGVGSRPTPAATRLPRRGAGASRRDRTRLAQRSRRRVGLRPTHRLADGHGPQACQPPGTPRRSRPRS